ncbi:hypothetical protein [Amycolatopsis sp. CA-128772]|uniref:hypothetical protein n=1 Tax=Amycolatopsis sp. CA-128772 TaxID=2073159 RepID=UPI001304AC12|nr:hypothetical protein [Amycolatopsis sp. CA-128772]
MADKDIKEVNPDAPVSPGTAPVPDLDVDVAQFMTDDPPPPRPGTADAEPPD